MTRPDDILTFWFGDSLERDVDLTPYLSRWFRHDMQLDRMVAERFGVNIDQAGHGELNGWCETARGRLALIILVDQFTRNAFRGTAKAYAFDSQAVQLCLDGLTIGADCELTPVERLFFYLPLLHSEQRADQAKSVVRFGLLAAECAGPHSHEFRKWLRLARRHRCIISLFGRFPHRNAIIGRRSTALERAFLFQAHLRAGLARQLRCSVGPRGRGSRS